MTCIHINLWRHTMFFICFSYLDPLLNITSHSIIVAALCSRLVLWLDFTAVFVLLCVLVFCVCHINYWMLKFPLRSIKNPWSCHLLYLSYISLANTKETFWEPTREMRGFLFGGSDWTFGTFDESITHQWGTSKCDWHILL